MAKEAKPAAERAAAAPPAGGNKKLLIIIIAVVVLLLGIGGGAVAFLMKGNAEHAEEDGEAPVEKPKPPKKKKAEKEAPPVYVAFEPFTVNLVPESGDQFLQLILSVEVDDLHSGEQLKQYMPKLRNDLTMILSTKKASELISKEGKEKLAEEIREQINGVLDPTGKGKKRDYPIKEVLFTSFIIQ